MNVHQNVKMEKNKKILSPSTSNSVSSMLFNAFCISPLMCVIDSGTTFGDLCQRLINIIKDYHDYADFIIVISILTNPKPERAEKAPAMTASLSMTMKMTNLLSCNSQSAYDNLKIINHLV